MPTISYWAKKYRTRVSALFGIGCLLLARPTPESLRVGAVFAVAGQAIRFWAAGCIHKNEMLTMTGPYSLSRNPLYVGSFLLGTGFIVATGVPWLLAAYLVFFAVLYRLTIQWEEEKLERIFPGQFDGYRRRVPRFVPLVRIPSYRKGEFSWSQVLKHREILNAAGAAAVYGILFGRLFF